MLSSFGDNSLTNNRETNRRKTTLLAEVTIQPLFPLLHVQLGRGWLETPVCSYTALSMCTVRKSDYSTPVFFFATLVIVKLLDFSSKHRWAWMICLRVQGVFKSLCETQNFPNQQWANLRSGTFLSNRPVRIDSVQRLINTWVKN